MQKTSSKIIFYLKAHTFLRAVKRKLFYSKKKLSVLDIANFVHNYKFQIDPPRTFNEYIVWLKLYYQNELWENCADKLGAKKYLSQNGFSRYLPKTYGIYKNSSEIDLTKLPEKFVLKTNHDCGTVFVCKKEESDFKKIFTLLDESLKKNYQIEQNEWVYKNIKPLIFSEEYLEPASGNDLMDYKFFIFNGNFGFGFVSQNRFKDVRFSVFDKYFNFYPVDYIYLRPKKSKEPVKPDCFNEMITISEQVGKKFDFIRVDMYWTTNGPKIGELTFFSMSGYGTFSKKYYDFEFGKFFENTIFYNLSHKKN